MTVDFGEDQCFRNLFPAREKSCKEVFTECANDRANLTGVHDVPIQLRRRIIDILVHLLPALFAGEPIAVLDDLLQQVRAVFRDVGVYQKDILSHVHAVDDRLLARIFADNILVEKHKSAFVRRCDQPDDEYVEIGEYLTLHML